MKLIEQNPFRLLGIPVNATAGDRAANKSKMKLLDIGKAVEFPLDLSSLIVPVARTKEAIATAERDINQPQDMVRHALFWFAKPSDPIGKMAYDNLLQENINTAVTNFKRSTSWEAKLCLATLNLIQGDVPGAVLAMAGVIESHCDEFVKAVAGQTYVTDADAVRQMYIAALTTEIDGAKLYTQLSETDVPDGFLQGLRDKAVESAVAEIEQEVASAKAIDSKEAEAQLKAGKRLKTGAGKHLSRLKRLVGSSDMRYGRSADKLANQILQCSINYHNAIDESPNGVVTARVVDDCLDLAEYARDICVGNLARQRMEKNIEILRDKKKHLPPAGVETEFLAIMNALKRFVDQPDKIEHSVTLLNTTKPHLQSMKSKLGVSNEFYLKISTQVVDNALHNLISEVNRVQKFSTSSDPTVQILSLTTIVEPVVNSAWSTTKIMDGFDMETNYRNNRYLPNRSSLYNLYNTIQSVNRSINTSSRSSSSGCYIATMVYGDYDHPQVMVLRGFRDDVLMQHQWGRAFVKFYYRNSPTWVEYLKDKKMANDIIRKILDGFIKIYKHEK